MFDRLDNSNEIFSRMQNKTPYATFKKTILGQVYVQYIDPFDPFLKEEKATFLRGDPEKNEAGCFIDLWSEKEKLYFVWKNQGNMQLGNLVEYTRPKEQEATKSVDDLTDADFEAVLSTGYFKLQSTLNKMTNPESAQRLLSVAIANEKSEKILNAIRARISELQVIPVEKK